MSKKIEIQCQGAAMVPIDIINDFQGKLKTLSVENYEKLRKQIIKDGFSEPVSVWKELKDGKVSLHLLNGHQRLRVVRGMIENEDFECPELPVSFVEAKSLKQAKRKCLSLTSQFGTMTTDGLLAFLEDSEIEVDEIDDMVFPEIDMDDFKDQFFSSAESDADQDEPHRDGSVFDRTPDQYNESIIKQIVLFYDKDRYETMLQKLEQLRGKYDALDFSEVVGRLVDEAVGA
jgi:hypothetical protein